MFLELFKAIYYLYFNLPAIGRRHVEHLYSRGLFSCGGRVMPSTNCCCLFFASRHSVVLEASLVVTVMLAPLMLQLAEWSW